MDVPKIPVSDVEDGFFRLGGCPLPMGCLPIILTGLVSQWRAVRLWRREGLKRRVGDETVRCMVLTRQDSGFLQQTNRSITLRFAEFLDRVFEESEKPQQLHYLRISVGTPLFEALSEDFEIPPLAEGYNPSATGIWMGQKGNITPFHHDWWHSFLAQVSGRKRYTLVHPMDAAALQEDWPAEARYDLAPAPILKSKERTALKKVEVAFRGILEPGQMLCIPAYWYHQIDTLENGNISMPIRFDSAQSPDTALFQFSQRSGLRSLTNQPDNSLASLIRHLKANRRHFRKREKEFVEAFRKERNPDISRRQVLQVVEASGEEQISRKDAKAQSPKKRLLSDSFS